MIRKLFFMVILCAGCIKDPPTGIGSVTGQWTLQTVDGKALPVTISGSGANQSQLTSEVYTLLEGNGYNLHSVTRVTVNGVSTDQTTVTTGNYGLQGNSVILVRSPDNLQRIGVVDNGGKMTIPDGGMVKVYSK